MRDPELPSTHRGTSIGGTILTVMVTLALVGSAWLFINRDNVFAAQAQPTVVAQAEAEPWPTVPATFTPAPTPAEVLIPTPTPIALPPPQVVSEWSVIKFTLASVQTAEGADKDTLKRIFGNDQVTLRVVGRVHVGIPLDQIERDLALQPDGRSITVRLPKLRVMTVEIIPEQTTIIEANQRWLLSSYPGLELQATAKGYTDLYEQVAKSPEMLQLATEMARLKMADHLRNLGFTDVEVTTLN